MDRTSTDQNAWMQDLPEAAQTYLDGKRLDEVECIISDLPGIARGKAVPANKFARQDYFHLPDSVFYQTITGDWGEAAGDEGFIERDMTLVPDMSTATAAPWTGDWTLQVIHDAYDRKKNPIPFSPRNVLKHVIGLYHAQGWEPVVAPEMEFYLVARNIDPAEKIKPMMGRSGRPAAARQAYSMTAVDEFGPVIDDIYDFAEAQGFEIDGITQEGGAGQLEINLLHGDPIKLADEVFYFKRLIREAALRHDCFATFMAKPIAEEPGSAMHIHHSVLDRKTGENIFAGPQGGDTDAFFHFIAGMQNPPAQRGRGSGALREQLSPLCERQCRADQLGMGTRQPHHGYPGATVLAQGTSGREPHRGYGLQPLSGDRRQPCSGLSGPDGRKTSVPAVPWRCLSGGRRHSA